MGISIKDWEERMKKLTIEEARKIAEGLETLEKLEGYKEEWGWTGIGWLKEIAKERAGVGVYAV